MSSKNPLHTDALPKFIDSGSQCKYLPGLYLIATPIGNLEDISLRALYTLNHVELVACEDTRLTRKLLQTYGIQKPLQSCHDHNMQEVIPNLLAMIEAGKMVAYVTDAGMPLISDPGFDLVQACRERNLYVTVIPGPSAPLTALVLSGLPSHEFYFGGFLPSKVNAREERLKQVMALPMTHIFFESPHRLVASLKAIAKLMPQVQVSVVRELTKIFEEVKTGPVEEVLSYYDLKPPKGEIVLLISPIRREDYDQETLEQSLQKYLKFLTLKEAVARVVTETKLPKKKIYQLALTLKHGDKKTEI